MDSLMKDWLGPFVEQQLTLGVAWIAQKLGVQCYDNIYEDDGSNLRIKVPLGSGVAGVVQILEFLTNEDPVQVVVADTHTKSRAKISTAAAAAFSTLHRRSVLDNTTGGLIDIRNFEIVATNLGPSDEQVSLLVTEFDWVSTGSLSNRGHPKNLHERDHIIKLIRELDAMRDLKASPAPKSADGTRTSKQSQGIRATQVPQRVRFEGDHDEGNGNNASVMSQVPFATQMPRQRQSTQTRVSDVEVLEGVNLSRPTAAGRSLHVKGNDANARGNTIPQDHLNLLNILQAHNHPGQPSGKAAERTIAAVSTSRAATTTGDSGGVVDLTKASEERGSAGKRHIPTAEGRDTEDNHGGQTSIELESAVVEPLTESNVQSKHARENAEDLDDQRDDRARRPDEDRDERPPGVRQGAAVRPSPAQTLRRHKAGEFWTPSADITRLICKIPEEQNTLLERPISWYPPPSSGASPVANIPLSVLNDLTSRTSHKSGPVPETSPKVQRSPPRASVLINVEYANATHGSGQNIDSDSDSESDSGAENKSDSASKSSGLEDEVSEDDAEPFTWDSSPEREKLPPDSSLPGRESSLRDVKRDVPPKGSQGSASDIEMSAPRPLSGLAQKKSLRFDSQPSARRESRVQAEETPYAARRGQTRGNARVRHADDNTATSPVHPSSAIVPNTLDPVHSSSKDGIHTNTDADVIMNDYLRSDSDELMLSQQLQHEIDAASQRSSFHSPVKPAPAQSTTVQTPLAIRPSPVKLQQGQEVAPGSSVESAGARSVGSKRGAEDRSPLDRPSKKSRRRERSFGFSQDEPVSQDPAALMRQSRREFLRSLSTSTDTKPSPPQLERAAAVAESPQQPDCVEMSDAHERIPRDSNGSATSDRAFAEVLRPSSSMQRTNNRQPQEVYDSAEAPPSGAGLGREAHRAVTDVPQSQPKLSLLLTSPDGAASVPAQQNSTGSTALFQSFKATYPDYKGDYKHFVGLCRKINKLQKAGRMEHRSLWDDFVVRHKTDYQPYVLNCSEEGDDPVPYEVFFKPEVEDVLHTKKVLTPATLAAAMGQEGEATASPALSSTMPTPLANHARRRTDRSRSPDRSPNNESRMPRPHRDDEPGRNPEHQPRRVAHRYRPVYSERRDLERAEDRIDDLPFEDNREIRATAARGEIPDVKFATHSPTQKSVDQANAVPPSSQGKEQKHSDGIARRERLTTLSHSAQVSAGHVASTAPPPRVPSSTSPAMSKPPRRPFPWQSGSPNSRSNVPASSARNAALWTQPAGNPPPSSMRPPAPHRPVPNSNKAARLAPASTSLPETHQPPNPEDLRDRRPPRSSLPASGRPASLLMEHSDNRRKTLGGTPSSSAADRDPKKEVRKLSMWGTLHKSKGK